MDTGKQYRVITEYSWFFLNLPTGTEYQVATELNHIYSGPALEAPVAVVIDNNTLWGWRNRCVGLHLDWIWTPLVWEVRWGE